MAEPKQISIEDLKKRVSQNFAITFLSSFIAEAFTKEVSKVKFEDPEGIEIYYKYINSVISRIMRTPNVTYIAIPSKKKITTSSITVDKIKDAIDTYGINVEGTKLVCKKVLDGYKIIVCLSKRTGKHVAIALDPVASKDSKTIISEVTNYLEQNLSDYTNDVLTIV